ncbi:MAG TPA: ShlB/FhaC/HecB family hemolysin secretion/activation protein [Coleofasciculaceae cyanobacterium]
MISASPAWGQASQALPTQQNPGLLTAPSTEVLSRKQAIRKQPKEPVILDEVHMDEPTNNPAKNDAPKLEDLKNHGLKTSDPDTMGPETTDYHAVLPDSPETTGFFVTRIEVEGSTLFSPEELRMSVRGYEGRNQTLTRLNTLVETLNRNYREKGYLTTQAYIPPQDIVDGRLNIRVQEGRIGRIGIEGNRFYRTGIITRALAQDAGDMLNIRELENDLNRSNRLAPGYKLRAKLVAGALPGETDVNIQVAERQPFQISPSYDNQGRPFIGMYRQGMEFRNDSLTGRADRLYARWLGASGTQIAMGSYSIPLNKHGTELGANFSFSRVNVDLGVKNPPEIIGKAYAYGLSLSQPLDRERHWTLDAGANWRSIDTYFEGDHTQGTEIRSLTTGLSYNHSDRWGRTYNRLQSTLGVGVMNADSKFWKLENYFNRVFVLPKRNLIILKAYGQITPDALPAAEQFQIGGASSVRGYTEGLLIGDRGVNLGIEHQFPIPGLKRVNPWLDDHLRGAWFYDVGRVWLDKSNPVFVSGQSNLPSRTFLQSAGFGFRAQLSRYMQGFLDFGFGLNNRDAVEPLSQPTARIHFGVRSDLLPENYHMRNPMQAPYLPRSVSSSRP